MNYKDFNDFELINYVNEDNERAHDILFEKYTPLIYKIAYDMVSCYKGSGIDVNDLSQEGFIGLSNAINNFDDNREASFYTFANTCIRRKMITAVTTTKRLKNRVLNEALSLDFTYDDDSTLEFLLKDDSNNPEDLLVDKEKVDKLIENIKEVLTDYEEEVFVLKINGYDYKEIALMLDKDLKSVDNAIQRIKFKSKEITGV